MTTNTNPRESYEMQANEWKGSNTRNALDHHDRVVSPSVSEKPITVDDGVVIDPGQVMRDALIAHRERQPEQIAPAEKPQN